MIDCNSSWQQSRGAIAITLNRAKTAPSFLIAGMLSLATVQLLANPTALFLLVPMMFPIYNSSILLASRRLA